MLKKGISWGNDHTISLVTLFTLDSKHPEEITSCEHLLPGLFRLGWRSQLNAPSTTISSGNSLRYGSTNSINTIPI